MSEPNKLTPNTPVISAKTLLLRNVEGNLSSLLQSQSEALPKDFNQTRFLQNCLAVLNDTEGIAECSPISIARTMLKGAYLGLDFFRKECYAIPYGGKLQFQTDYKGEVKIISKHSVKKIKDIYAKLVRDGDDFAMNIEDGKQTVNFKPRNFNDGNLQGVFAVVYFDDGSMSCDAMSIKEIEAVRNSYSKAPKSPAWIKSYGEMCKKTVIRRLCKMISIEFDNQEQAKAFDEGGDVSFDKTTPKEKPRVEDPFAADAPIDVTVSPQSPGIPGNIEAPDPDAHLRREFKEMHPEYEDWKIDALVKERKGI